jgi:hypothetical protein
LDYSSWNWLSSTPRHPSKILQLSHFIVGALKPKDVLLLILTLQEFTINTWGMFVFFKAYSGWQHESPSVAGYCPKVPILTAFAYLVANAVGSLIVFCFASGSCNSKLLRRLAQKLCGFYRHCLQTVVDF